MAATLHSTEDPGQHVYGYFPQNNLSLSITIQEKDGGSSFFFLDQGNDQPIKTHLPRIVRVPVDFTNQDSIAVSQMVNGSADALYTGSNDAFLILAHVNGLLLFNKDRKHDIYYFPDGVRFSDIKNFNLEKYKSSALITWETNEGKIYKLFVDLENLNVRTVDPRSVLLGAVTIPGSTNVVTPNASLDTIQISEPVRSESPTTNGLLAATAEGPMDDSNIFTNGARLVHENGSVYFVRPNGERLLVTDQPLFQSPDRVHPSTILITTQKNVLAVHASGRIQSLGFEVGKATLNYRKEKDGEGSVPYVPAAQWQVSNEGQNFTLLSFQYDSSKKPVSPGETFVIDENGEVVRIAYKHIYPTTKFSVDDGILTIENVDREVDLRNLEGENAYFRVRVPPVTLAPDGTVVTDPVTKFNNQFTNLTKEFRSGRMRAFDLDVEDEDVVRRIREILAQPESPNPVILGGSGSGKTQLLYAFVAGVARGAYKRIPRTIPFYAFDRTTLEQGTRNTGSFDSALQLARATAAIVGASFIGDEFTNLAGSGTHSGNTTVDGLALLKPFLLNGEMRFVATATYVRWINTLGGDNELLRRFTTIEKSAPSRERVMKILDSWADRYGIPRLQSDVKQFLYTLSETHIAVGEQPSKATSILNAVVGRNRDQGREFTPITEDDLIDVLVRGGVPRELFDPEAARKAYQELDRTWGDIVIGQDEVFESLKKQEALRLAGLNDPKLPPIRLLTSGPRGTGKTFGFETFARLTNRKLVKFNMSDYSEGGVEKFQRLLLLAIRTSAHSALLFDEIDRAHSTVRDVLLAILQDGKVEVPMSLLATDRAPNTTVTIDFRQAAIGATTNAGEQYVITNLLKATNRLRSEEFGIRGVGSGESSMKMSSRAKEIRRRVQETFGLKEAIVMGSGMAEPLVDRFVVVPSLPPTRPSFRRIVNSNISKMLKDYADLKEYEFEFDPADRETFLDFADAVYYHENMSNRIVNEILNEHIRIPLAEILRRSPSEALIQKVYLKFSPDSGEAIVEIFEADTCSQKLTSNGS